MNKQLLVAALAVLPLAACAADGRIPAKALSDTVDVSGPVKIEMDGGTLIVEPSSASSMTYQVEYFGEGGWIVDLFGDKGPTPEQLEKCTASYSAGRGLVIRRHGNVEARARITVPAGQALEVRLGGGKADIGAMTGQVDARVDQGLLVFDGSALAPGVCVEATVKQGGVENQRDRDCKSVGVKLHTGAGKVDVL